MILLLMLIGFSFFVGLVMEFYKKYIRKNRTTELENRIVALILSIIFGVVIFFSITVTALPDEMKYTPLLIILFTVAIYSLQYPACMAVWKPLVRKWLERKFNG
ncbi:MAG: hypothetical protein M0Q94_12515 [Candidatus Cloacimonetes bacterium]|nr:hypothetical protein [Candidatus Cloacimonadota bacterium]